MLEFLGLWLAGSLLTEGVKLSSKTLSDAIDLFQRDHRRLGWDQELTERDQRLLEALKNTSPAYWKRYILHGPLVKDRPIAIWGPSGTGKTIIADRIAGGSPKYTTQSSSTMERTKLISGWKGLNIFTAPGSGEQDKDGSTVAIKNQLIGDTPPKVFCYVVSGGYHATSASYLTGTFQRPGSQGEAVSETIEGYREKCLEEELMLLQDILKHCSGRMKTRIPVFLTIINKRDIWSAGSDSDQLISRYSGESDYTKIVKEICNCWGLGNAPAVHEVYPCYSFAGGFHPDTNIQLQALTASNAEADAMVLRALIYYHYTDGAGAA